MWTKLLQRLMAEEDGGDASGAGGSDTGSEQASDSTDENSSGADDGQQSDDASTDGETSNDDNTDSEQSEDGASDGAPDDYAEFNMPDGMQADEAMLEAYTPALKELNLTQDQAQKLVDIQSQLVQANVQKQADAFSKQLDDWKTASESDTEFGGDKLEESVALAESALTAFGTPELKEMMNNYGINNNPELIRFMVRVGKAIGEDDPQGGSSVQSTKDRQSILYPDS